MASSVWKGHLTFGLVSFPIRLFSAARSETISFNLLHKEDHSRIKQVTYCQAEDKPVPRSELVKGYEYEKDRYVEIDDEDIKKVAPEDRQGDGDPRIRQVRTGGPDLPGELLLRGPRRRRREAVRAAVPGSQRVEILCAGQGGHAQPRAHHRAASRRQGHSLPHHVLSGRDPAGGRVPHRYQPGEGEGADDGQDADLLAGSRFRAAEISRHVTARTCRR